MAVDDLADPPVTGNTRGQSRRAYVPIWAGFCLLPLDASCSEDYALWHDIDVRMGVRFANELMWVMCLGGGLPSVGTQMYQASLLSRVQIHR